MVALHFYDDIRTQLAPNMVGVAYCSGWMDMHCTDTLFPLVVQELWRGVKAKADDNHPNAALLLRSRNLRASLMISQKGVPELDAIARPLQVVRGDAVLKRKREATNDAIQKSSSLKRSRCAPSLPERKRIMLSYSWAHQVHAC